MLQSRPVSQLEKVLNVTFKDLSVLEMAVTHSSYAKSLKEQKGRDNERLEFLGDAVLKLIVSNYLYHHYPNESEGFMTKIRSRVVSDKILSQLADSIELGKYLRLSYGEAQTGGATKVSNLANAFEAVLGALYLDQGLQTAETVFLSIFLSLKNQLESDSFAVDYKTLLQEWSQSEKLALPCYEVIKEEGPDHDKTFYVSVSVQKGESRYYAEGNAHSKKSAEQEAAKRLVDQLGVS